MRELNLTCSFTRVPFCMILFSLLFFFVICLKLLSETMLDLRARWKKHKLAAQIVRGECFEGRREFVVVMVYIHSIRCDKTFQALPFYLQALASSFDHQFSADRKYLLLASNYQKVSTTNIDFTVK